MKEEIWVVEVNMDSISPNEFRVKKADDMLKINAVRALIKAGGLSTKIEFANWVAVAVAFDEKQANRKWNVSGRYLLLKKRMPTLLAKVSI